MISSRSLDDLAPDVAAAAQQLIDACAAVSIDLLVVSTYRDADAQAALYAQGRTTPGPIVTDARPGESFHQYRVALDFCPIINGKCQWDDIATFTRIGLIAEGLGMEWAGRWTAFREYGHVQLTNLSLMQLAALDTSTDTA